MLTFFTPPPEIASHFNDFATVLEEECIPYTTSDFPTEPGVVIASVCDPKAEALFLSLDPTRFKRIAYYDHPEGTPPPDYQRLAERIMLVADAILFANKRLPSYAIYPEVSAERIGLGYYPFNPPASLPPYVVDHEKALDYALAGVRVFTLSPTSPPNILLRSGILKVIKTLDDIHLCPYSEEQQWLLRYTLGIDEEWPKTLLEIIR